MQRYGAPPEAWDHFMALGLTADLLPVVSNPDAEISALSTMQGKGKTPSFYNRDRKVIGFPKWTQFVATETSIAYWRSEPDYGICVKTGRVGAFDIDVPDTDKAKALVRAIEDVLGYTLPMRYRGDSGKRLLAFRIEEPKTKRVIPVEGGMIEVLGDGQQFVAIGRHPDGARYRWTTGEHGPKHIPTLTEEEFNNVWSTLALLYATGEPRIARERRDRLSTGAGGDDVADWLIGNWETYDIGADGQVFIECPFADQHTTDSGPTATVYFPAGTGGFERGHFVCLHAHCAGREDHSYLDATGYSLAQFDDLTEPTPTVDETRSAANDPTSGADRVAGKSDTLLGTPVANDPDGVRSYNSGEAPWPVFARNNGKIEPKLTNMVPMLQNGWMVGRWIAYDRFTDNLVWTHRTEHFDRANWRVISDDTVTRIRMELEARGVDKPSTDLYRQALHAAAKANTMDTAQTWLAGLDWDGVSRAEEFCIKCWGWDDTPYSRAVGLYVWSALAGRVIEPGVQADMAPILVGEQGIRKTTAIKSMVPHPDMYGEIRLDMKDDDQSRVLRGKLVGEIEELRGLNSRAIEEIKAFVSRRRESWVPKYKEFENHFWRRNLLIGSTNEFEFLADPTGERRWLPGVSKFIDVDYVRTFRDQLWAEGAVLFTLEGVLWQRAEKLAKAEHRKFKVGDAWELAILRWLATEEDMAGAKPMDKGFILSADVMEGALRIAPAHQNRAHEQRVRKVLVHLGFTRLDDGAWVR